MVSAQGTTQEEGGRRGVGEEDRPKNGKNEPEEKRGIGCGWRPTQGRLWGGQGKRDGCGPSEIEWIYHKATTKLDPELTGTFPLSPFPWSGSDSVLQLSVGGGGAVINRDLSASA